MLAFHAAHSIHTPLETLPDSFERFAFIEDSEDRRAYHSMVYNVDRDITRRGPCVAKRCCFGGCAKLV